MGLGIAAACSPKPLIVKEPVPIPCPTVKIPPRPALVACHPTDTHADCAEKRRIALEQLAGYAAKLEALLAGYQQPAELK